MSAEAGSGQERSPAGTDSVAAQLARLEKAVRVLSSATEQQAFDVQVDAGAAELSELRTDRDRLTSELAALRAEHEALLEERALLEEQRQELSGRLDQAIDRLKGLLPDA